ncbi:hypothetical protein SAMN05428959_10987 [Duganella sp. CF517]|uniref:alpha/beta hydrolase n=1 Tax=Duganella sp. CF517 TaxID=1881038 RepID=UPI0008BE5707|nr:alpha/beta fold hydrolase [Duganella sp. CF517]SEO52142.1 hypothetical protein SAMN05428959_10987 [Duganella sp. CF517]
MKNVVIAGLVLALSTGCAVQITERNVIRPDRPGDPKPEAVLDAAAAPAWRLSALTLPVAEGELGGVAASRASGAQAAATTVLYFGGNAFHLDQHGRGVLDAVAPCGVDVVMVDYRGYGRSTGVPTIAAMRADALQAFDFVNARHPGRVVLHGQSLGSFIAAYVARQRPAARALVLESTTTNARDWANAMLPWYVWPFVRLELSGPLRGIDNVEAVAGYAGPALVLEGADDNVTPPRLVAKVYEAMPSPVKRMLVVPGAGHNDVLSNPATQPAYCAFIRQVASI